MPADARFRARPRRIPPRRAAGRPCPLPRALPARLAGRGWPVRTTLGRVQRAARAGRPAQTSAQAPPHLPRARTALAGLQSQINYSELLEDPNVAKISVVGVGMRSHAGVANTMFSALADKAINIQVISTSEIKVSVLIAAEYTELAVRALHTAYGLDAN